MADMEKRRKIEPGAIECRGCEYWRAIGHGKQCIRACHYCIETGNLRGMPAAECYKHEGTPYKPKKRGVKHDKRA